MEVGSTEVGYQFPYPINADPELAAKVFENMPVLRSVVAISTPIPPFRATGVYLGKFKGEYLFVTSRHVGDKKPQSAHLSLGFRANGEENQFHIPLDPEMLFASTFGDFAILKANTKSLSLQDITELSNLEPFVLSAINIKTLAPIADLQRAIIAGRTFSPYFDRAHETDSLWPKNTIELKSKILSEAEQNMRPVKPGDKEVDENAGFIFQRRGDVLTLAAAPILGGGAEQILDPDGLVMNEFGGSAFLQSARNWKVQSYATKAIGVGRNSGSPLILPVANGFVVTGLLWTAPALLNTGNEIEGSKDIFPDIILKENPDTGKEELFATNQAVAGSYSGSVSAGLEQLRFAVNSLNDTEKLGHLASMDIHISKNAEPVLRELLKKVIISDTKLLKQLEEKKKQ